jgi:hypothetical protein
MVVSTDQRVQDGAPDPESRELDALADRADGELPGARGWLAGVDPPPLGGLDLIPERARPGLAYLVGISFLRCGDEKVSASAAIHRGSHRANPSAAT